MNATVAGLSRMPKAVAEQTPFAPVPATPPAVAQLEPRSWAAVWAAGRAEARPAELGYWLISASARSTPMTTLRAAGP